MSESAAQPVVGIVMFPGVEVLDFAGPYEVFSMAGTGETHRYFRVITVAINREDAAAREIRCTGGMRVICDHVVDDCPKLDVMIVPGGPGARNRVDQRRVIEFIGERAAVEGTVTASVCTGTYLLGRAGLLDGKRATTHPGRMEQFRAEHPDVELVAAKIVDLGNLMTAGGVTSGIDLALHLLGKFFGREARAREAKRLDGPWV
jgi:transcriptional regulator GlxA family with amidase domain